MTSRYDVIIYVMLYTNDEISLHTAWAHFKHTLECKHKKAKKSIFENEKSPNFEKAKICIEKSMIIMQEGFV